MKKVILAVIITAIVAAAALITVTPVALAGSWTVKINTALRPQVSFGTATEYFWIVTAHDYYYTMRSGGSATTNDIRVNGAAGNFTGFISWFFINPSNQTVKFPAAPLTLMSFVVALPP